MAEETDNIAVNEGTPLLQSSPQQRPDRAQNSPVRNRYVVYGSFIGVFLAAADEALVLSTWSMIASQFRRLSQGSWLLIAYNFGYCVSLPVYGTLCDLYGRRNVLLGAYALFAVGGLICGISTSIIQLILGRVIAGISGGGMVSLVSIIITDLLPPEDVALYRGFANVVNAAGRSFGAPIGGLLISTIGWRWSFLGQLPLVAICLLAAFYGIPSSSSNPTAGNTNQENTSRTPIWRLDFGGLASFAVAMILLLFLLHNVGSTEHAGPLAVLLPSFIIAILVFLTIEAYWAPKPLIPLPLLKTSLGGYCISQVFLFSSRTGLLSNVVPYLIRVKKATDLYTSWTFVVGAVGVSIGGVTAGAIVKRTRRYKIMTVVAVCGLFVNYLVMFIRWRTDFKAWELVYLLPNGLFTGVLLQTQFMGMTQSAPQESMPTCITTFYLCQQLGLVLGPATSVAVVQRVFSGKLEKNLETWEEKKLIGRILNDARFAEHLSPAVQRLVRCSYLFGFQLVPLISAASCLVMIPLALWLKEVEIK